MRGRFEVLINQAPSFRRVQLAHPLVQQCLEQKAGISIIIEALCTTADVEISAVANFKDTASVSAKWDEVRSGYIFKLPLLLLQSEISSKVVPADASLDYDRSRSTKLTIPSGTTLVFHCLDLEVDPRNGNMRCAVFEGGLRHHTGYFCCAGDTTDGARDAVEC